MHIKLWIEDNLLAYFLYIYILYKLISTAEADTVTNLAGEILLLNYELTNKFIYTIDKISMKTCPLYLSLLRNRIDDRLQKVGRSSSVVAFKNTVTSVPWRCCREVWMRVRWWWWWLMFYSHFCAQGRLNGPSDFQR